MKTYTSEQILQNEEMYDISENVCSSGIGIKYILTEGELGWLDFVHNKYSIAEYINSNMTDGILTIQDSFELSKALDYDCKGAGKATCLSDDTALQKIFFFCYSEYEFNEE
jgi:hypothetical protein